ncbi:MAG: hypothetical protein IJV44_12980 [Prevotella sp.]|nr:hypothetical protein [Prevotella sp.]
MKRIIASIVAVTATVGALGQNPVKLSDDNLKGNVFAVKYGKYEYKENFGEPTTGQVQEIYSTFYNEVGNSIIFRKIRVARPMFVDSYALFYESNGENTLVTSLGISSSIDFKKYDDISSALNIDNDTFEKLMQSELGYGQECRKAGRYESTFDKNGVRIKYDIYIPSGRLDGKEVGKSVGNGTYEFAIYDWQGESREKSTRTFANGKLTKKSSPNDGRINIGGSIESPESGTYTYDSNGRLTHLIRWNKHETKYIYNDKGDLSHTSNKDFKIWSDGYFYENYKYDSHGNWIFRTWGAKAGEPKYIETREIIYCDTKDELKGKAEQLLQTVGDIIKAKQQ